MSAVLETGVAVWARGVRKHFGEGEARVEALRDVDFEARSGELTFLVGPSGCGKTTLISIIAGLLDRTGGDLSVLGTRLDDLSGAERVLFRRRSLGFIFQTSKSTAAFIAMRTETHPAETSIRSRSGTSRHVICRSVPVPAESGCSSNVTVQRKYSATNLSSSTRSTIRPSQASPPGTMK